MFASKTLCCLANRLNFLPRYFPCWEATWAVCGIHLTLVTSREGYQRLWLTAGNAVIPRPRSSSKWTTSFTFNESSLSVSYFSKISRTLSRCLDVMGDLALIWATERGESKFKCEKRWRGVCTHPWVAIPHSWFCHHDLGQRNPQVPASSQLGMFQSVGSVE